MQESTQNPQPVPPAAGPQDIHWGITYLHQYVQDLREDVRQLGEELRQDMRKLGEELRQDMRKLNERFDAQNERLDAKIDGVSRELRGEIGVLAQRQDALLQRQDSHFRWLMGTMITLFVSLGGVILAAAKL